MTANNRAHRSHTPRKLNEAGMRAALTVGQAPAAGFEPTADGVTAEDVRVNA